MSTNPDPGASDCDTWTLQLVPAKVPMATSIQHWWSPVIMSDPVACVTLPVATCGAMATTVRVELAKSPIAVLMSDSDGRGMSFARAHDGSADIDGVTQHEGGGVAGAGVEDHDAAQKRLVVYHRRVAQTARQELHHAEPSDDPVAEPAQQNVRLTARAAGVRHLTRADHGIPVELLRDVVRHAAGNIEDERAFRIGRADGIGTTAADDAPKVVAHNKSKQPTLHDVGKLSLHAVNVLRGELVPRHRVGEQPVLPLDPRTGRVVGE